jgi:RNA polymerase sigma factor (sigma-70 family)
MGMEVLKRTASYFASRYGDLHSEREFTNLGYLRLDSAVRSYDDKRDPFEPYAWQAIHGAMTNAVGKQIRAHKRAYDAGNRAVSALRDESNPMRDGEDEYQEHLDQFTGSVLIAMVLGTVGRATGESSQGATDEHAAKGVDYRRARGKLSAAVNSLPPEQQQIVELYYYGDDDNEENDERQNEENDEDDEEDKTPSLRTIGAIQGVSYATVRRHHQEALTTLRQSVLPPKTGGPKK